MFAARAAVATVAVASAESAAAVADFGIRAVYTAASEVQAKHLHKRFVEDRCTAAVARVLNPVTECAVVKAIEKVVVSEPEDTSLPDTAHALLVLAVLRWKRRVLVGSRG